MSAGTEFIPGPDTARLLRDAFGRFATGVTVVTCGSEDGPVGITANSFSSVSMDPPLVLWSPSRASRRFPYFEAAGHYAIHVLSAEQADLCVTLSKNAYALAEIAHTLSDDGVPLLEGALARFECRQRALYDGGDHVIVLGQVMRAELRDGDALAFYAGKMGQIAQP
ncbi:MAG: flavin reductase family protein [Paracoccaceae bacterium]